MGKNHKRGKTQTYKFRRRNGLTLDELGARLGLSHNYLSLIELRRKQEPPWLQLALAELSRRFEKKKKAKPKTKKR